MDNRLDLERTARTIEALHPDIVLLQEVDRGAARTGGVDQAGWLGTRLGMRSGFVPFMDFDGGAYGMGILSRLPLEGCRTLALPPGRHEPRTALDATVRLPDGRAVQVVGVHLDWLENDQERFAQATALVEQLATIDGPLVAAGDFNDQPPSRTIELVRRTLTEVPKPGDAHLTFPADTPTIEIDYVWSRGDMLRPRGATVIDERVASDHRPVLALIDLAAPQSGGATPPALPKGDPAPPPPPPVTAPPSSP